MNAPRILALREGVVWTAGSLIIAAGCALATNAIVLSIQGPESLGRFTETMSIYLVTAQLAVLGVHLSTLRNCATVSDDGDGRSDIVSAGLTVAGVASVLTAAAFWFARHNLKAAFGTPGLDESLAVAAPGLVCFAANKVLLGALNGFKEMRAFALFSALRYLFIVSGVTCCCVIGIEATLLPAAVSTAEAALMVLLILFLNRLGVKLRMPSVEWCRRHLEFGSKAAVSGLLVETNSKIDIFVLGLLTSSRVVGMYSLPQAAAEGFAQLVTVVRQNIDPHLARAMKEPESGGTDWIVGLVKSEFVPILGGIALLLGVAYPIGLRLLGVTESLGQSTMAFAVLLTGVVASARWKAFAGVLLQGGKPGLYSPVQLLSSSAGALLCVLLVAKWGMLGAALSVATMSVAEGYLIVTLARRYVNVAI